MALIGARVFTGGLRKERIFERRQFFSFQSLGEIFRSLYVAINMPKISAASASSKSFKNIEKKIGRS